MVQESLEKNHDGQWEPLELPKDESFIKLQIGVEFIGRFVATKPNPNFKDRVIHVFEMDEVNEETGEQLVRQINGTTNLDKWLSLISPGDYVRILRVKDKKLPNQPQPLQRHEVSLWVSGKKTDLK